VLRQNQLIREILAKHTGQPIETIIRDTDRDFFMDANAAKEYGLIDEILQSANADALPGANGAKA
jgi:ATP-dependent Clp protease protease subunit